MWFYFVASQGSIRFIRCVCKGRPTSPPRNLASTGTRTFLLRQRIILPDLLTRENRRHHDCPLDEIGASIRWLGRQTFAYVRRSHQPARRTSEGRTEKRTTRTAEPIRRDAANVATTEATALHIRLRGKEGHLNVSETLRFDGRTVVVTGGGRGLGRAYAELLASRGASVVVNDLGTSLDGAARVSSPADSVVDFVTRQGGRAVADTSDVSTEQGAQSLIDAAVDRFGRIDVLIHNAGIVRRAPFAEMSTADFDRHVAVHQAGAFHLARAAWSHFVRQRYGRVIITVSTAMFGLPEIIPYGSAKGGAFGLARGLALEGASNNIRVNMVAPSAMTRMASGDSTVWSPTRNEMIPKREAGMDSDKVAPLVAVLAHERCPVNGETYYAAGGRVSRIFVGQTSGQTFSQVTPEQILDQWVAINDRDHYSLPVISPDAQSVSWLESEFDPVLDS